MVNDLEVRPRLCQAEGYFFPQAVVVCNGLSEIVFVEGCVPWRDRFGLRGECPGDAPCVFLGADRRSGLGADGGPGFVFLEDLVVHPAIVGVVAECG